MSKKLDAPVAGDRHAAIVLSVQNKVAASVPVESSNVFSNACVL